MLEKYHEIKLGSDAIQNKFCKNWRFNHKIFANGEKWWKMLPPPKRPRKETTSLSTYSSRLADKTIWLWLAAEDNLPCYWKGGAKADAPPFPYIRCNWRKLNYMFFLKMSSLIFHTQEHILPIYNLIHRFPISYFMPAHPWKWTKPVR